MWKMTKFNDRKSRAARRRDRGDIAVQESRVKNWSETRASCLENTNSALCLHARAICQTLANLGQSRNGKINENQTSIPSPQC